MATITKRVPLDVQRTTVAHWHLHWLALPALLGALAFALALIVLAQPYRAQIAIGGEYDRPFVRGFYTGESGDDSRFRWSRPEAEVVLPGAGAQSPLSLRLHGDYPGMTVRLDAGNGAFNVPLRPGWQRITVLPRVARWSGDVRVAIFAPTQRSEGDPRVRGVAVSDVVLRGTGKAAPVGQAVLIGVSTLLGALLVRRTTGQTWLACIVGLVLALGGATLLAWNDGASRLALTSYTGRLALALALGGALVVVVERGIRDQGSGIRDQGSERATTQLTTHNSQLTTHNYLAGATLLAFLLRFGAMAYPLNFISDLRFSVQRATMVRDGRFGELFLPNPALTPTQWDLDGPIPRSPFYYVVTAPLMTLPGDAAPLAMLAFSAAVDAIAVLLVAVIVRKLGGSQRQTLFAALLAGVAPLPVQMAISWGIFPTLLAQCLLLFAMTVWLHQRSRLHTRRGWVMFGAALTLAYISYPTALLFGGLLWLTLLTLLALRRDAAAGGTLKAGIVAALLALVLFYGWHIPTLVEHTLPTFVERFSGVAAQQHTTNDTFQDSRTIREIATAIWQPLPQKSGALIVGLALGGAGLLVLNRRRELPRGGVLLSAWWLVYVPLALMNGYVVTFILKHIVFMQPAMAILGGLLLGRLAAWRWGAWVAGGLVALLLWQTLLMEWNAVLTAFQSLK